MKTRFCPSPTGLIHLGNARTALFNALLAKHAQGTFLLRIEDTDMERSKNEFTQALMRDLCWIQAKWDEGPDIGGQYGPYWQSEREAIYNRYYKKLESMDLAYPCFCSEEQLKLSRKVQRASGQAPRYTGTCAHLSETEIKAKIAQGLKPSLRFRVPKNTMIEFDDLVKGKQKFNSDDIGDFIIRRSTDAPSFMFANAIDDSMMQVTHAIRGEDHLTNTPRQLMILQALEMPAPQYGHASLILGHDNSPFSKRHGSKSLQELREDGWLYEAIINYLARLGHYYADNDFMSLNQLAEKFSLEHLSRSPAKFDPQQMLYWQKEAINRISNAQFWQWLKEHAINTNAIPTTLHDTFITAIKPNTIFPQDTAHWIDIIFNDTLLFNENATTKIKAAGKQFFTTAIVAAQRFGSDTKAITEYIKAQCEVKGKALFMPLRFALTGEQHGPELAPLGKLLGAEKILQRLTHARDLCDA